MGPRVLRAQVWETSGPLLSKPGLEEYESIDIGDQKTRFQSLPPWLSYIICKIIIKTTTIAIFTVGIK